MTKGLAVISVSDKTGLEAFAKGLAGLGIRILSSGGTHRFLDGVGVKAESVDSYTGHPEILDGRVKTLHPKIHGGILARRDRDSDLRELEENGILGIDFVVVNLYPFFGKVKEVEHAENPQHGSLLEFIDIGGPTMLRAAAKNYRHVVPICDPADYPKILEELKTSGQVSETTRRQLAGKVFLLMSAYDGAIARYFSLSENLLDEQGKGRVLAPVEPIILERVSELRYGENPHQHAALYRPYGTASAPSWKVVQGKELSHNNLLDFYAALDLFLEILDGAKKASPAVVIKHANPSGAAIAADSIQAYKLARDCDPVSAFGGIVVVAGEVGAELAKEITSVFVEVVVVEKITPEAQEVFAKKKNVRLIICDYQKYLAARTPQRLQIRAYLDDYLLQTFDATTTMPSKAKVVSATPPSDQQMADLDFAWKVCKHVKSNAIVLVKDGQAIGVGAGQMSRVDAAKIAVQRAKTHGHSLEGAVAASDAFLPFPDTLEILNEAGIVALAQPGGSVKDEEVIASADSRKVAMVFTGERHFRH